VLTLACGVAVAAAQSVPIIVGTVRNPSTGLYQNSLSGPVAVATQNTPQGWYAYAPSYYNNDLAAISMVDPTHPTIVGYGTPNDGGTQLDGSSTVNIFGGIAYVVSKNQNGSCSGVVGSPTCNNNDNGTGNALALFNVTANPAAPQYLGSISDAATPHSNLFGAYGVTVTAINGTQYAVVAAQGCLTGQPCPHSTFGNDLALISLTDPSSPQYAGSVSNATATSQGWPNALNHPTAVAVSGNYAYVTSFYGRAFTVVNIANPANPTVVWSSNKGSTTDAADFPQPSDVTIQGNYAYVANQNTNASGQGTFTVVDIANPLSPSVVGTVNSVGLAGGYRVRVSGNTAYVAAHNANAITDIDITVPADPIVTASTVSQAYLYGTSGLDLMNLSGNEYVIASSSKLSSEPSSNYPPFPASTGTISALEIETPPANSALPTVTGATAVGWTITANVGTWTGTTPLAYSYQWQRCDAQGANCSVLKTATQTYPLTAPDMGATLRVVVKASNGAGSSTATSATTGVVTACPSQGKLPAYCLRPKDLVRPVVTGTTEVGQLLVMKSGTWSKLPASAHTSAQTPTTRVQWLRCDARGEHCKAIARATHLTYRVTNHDLKRRLKLKQTATNRNGASVAMSNPSASIVSSGTGITMVLKVSPQPQLVSKGYVVASLRSNVGTLLDAFVAIQVGGGAHWTAGTPTEARPGVPLKFKVVLSPRERTRLRKALAAHKKITAEVFGARFITPGRSGYRQTKPQRFTVAG
jgi:hypothetical protein